MTEWPHPDDEAGETIRVHPDGFRPQPAYETPYRSAPYVPPRPRSIAPLLMVTVMVMTVVAGAVTVVYLLTGDRDARAEPAAVTSAAPSAPAASGAADGCLVGEWQGTVSRWDDPENGISMVADAGPIYRLRADTTGELDFGSGITLKGRFQGVTTEMMYIGKVLFRYTATGGTLTYTDLRIDARRVTFQSGRVVENERLPADTWDPDPYSCAGDVLTVTSDGEKDEYRRR